MISLICRKEYMLQQLEESFPQTVISESFSQTDAEVLIADPSELTKKNLSSLTNLKLVISSRAGFDAADTDWMKQQKIIFCNSRGLYSQPIAEFIVERILAFSTNSLQYYQQQLKHQYQTISQRELLSELTIGFLGTGSIAQYAASLLAVFHPNVIGYKRTHVSELKNFDNIFYPGQLKEFLGKSDIVVVTVDLNQSTYHILGEKEFCWMKNGATLINVARGSIINEHSLIESLRNGKLAYAALDVFEDEPLPISSPLWNMNNVLITPHASGICSSNHMLFTKMVIDDIRRWEKGIQLVNRVF